MTGTIEMLNVGDGDAIIISLKNESRSLVMVVDGGHSGDYSRIVSPALTRVLKDSNKQGPDIVVCTHYDADHIAGLIPLVKEHIGTIKEVWVHRSPELSNHEMQVINEAFSKQKYGVSQLNEITENLKIRDQTISEDVINEKLRFIIESVGQLEKLLNLISKDKVKETFAGYTLNHLGWPEIEVLGPTQSYYRSLFPSNKILEVLIADEIIGRTDFALKENLQRKRMLELTEHNDPCILMKDESTAKITATNKASIIFSINVRSNKYLFTGDAGIESFKKIPNWQTALKDIFWLKVPHHGSENNLSTELVKVMNPKYAYSSGDRHEDEHVLNCLATRTLESPSSTKVNGDLRFKIS